MQTNEEIEKYQREIYQGTLAMCTFDIEADNGTVLSPVLDIQKPGVTLHFLRHAIFPKEFYLNGDLTEVSYSGDIESTSKKSDSDMDKYRDRHPILENITSRYGNDQMTEFICAKTDIEDGYLYILTKKGSQVRILEYRALNTYLYPISWGENIDEEGNYKDKRICSSRPVDSVIVKPGKKYFFAFSKVQLSMAFIENSTKDQDSIDERFITEDIDDYPYTEVQHTYINDTNVNYLGVHALYYNKGIDHQNSSVTNNHNCRRLKNKLVLLGEKEKSQNVEIQKQNQETSDNIENRLEDVFITLHDPISCMHDMEEYYGYKLTEFSAFIGQIQSGSSVADKYTDERDLGEGEMDGGSISEVTVIGSTTNPKNSYALLNSHESLFNYASLAYQFVYNNNNSIEEYSKAIDQEQYKRISNDSGEEVDGRGFFQGGASLEKLEALLGVEKRDELKLHLIKIRKDIFDLISGYYLHYFLFDYFDSVENKLSLRADLLSVIRLIYADVGDVDRHITLKRKITKENNIKKNIQELIDYVITYNGVAETEQAGLTIPKCWQDTSLYRSLTTQDEKLATPFLYALTSPIELDINENEIDFKSLGDLSWVIPPSATTIEKKISNYIVIYAHLSEICRPIGEYKLNEVFKDSKAYRKYHGLCKSLKGNVVDDKLLKLEFKGNKIGLTIGKYGKKAFDLMDSAPFQGLIGIIEFHNAIINIQVVLSSDSSGSARAKASFETIKASAGMVMSLQKTEPYLIKAIDSLKVVLEKYTLANANYIARSTKRALGKLTTARAFSRAFVIYNVAAAVIAGFESYELHKSRNKDSAALTALSAGLFLVAAASTGLVLGVLLLSAMALQWLASYLKETALQQIMHYSLIGSWSEQKKMLNYNLDEYKEYPWQLNLFFRSNVKALTALEYREDKSEANRHYRKKAGLFSKVSSAIAPITPMPLVSGYYMYLASSDYSNYPNFEDIVYTHKSFISFLAKPTVKVERKADIYSENSDLNWFTRVILNYTDSLLMPNKDSIQVVTARLVSNNENDDKKSVYGLDFTIEDDHTGGIEMNFSAKIGRYSTWDQLKALCLPKPYVHIAFRVIPHNKISLYNEASFPFKNQEGDDLFFYVRINLNVHLRDPNKNATRTSLVSQSQLQKLGLID